MGQYKRGRVIIKISVDCADCGENLTLDFYQWNHWNDWRGLLHWHGWDDTRYALWLCPDCIEKRKRESDE